MRSGTSAQIVSVKKISRRRKLGVLAAAVAGVLAFRAAQAVDYTWDAVGTPGVAPAGGAGVWNTAGLNWTNDAGASYIAWPNTDPNSDNAIFGGTAGTVSLGAAINSSSLTFTSSGYLIDNGGNIANTLTSSSVSVGGAATAEISAIIAGGGGLTKSGAGTLIVSGANTYTGNTNIFDGTLRIGAGGNINAAGDLTIFFGTLDVGANSAAANVVNLAAGASIIGTGTLTASSYQIGDGTISANLAGATASLVKTTPGALVLSGSNTFGGGIAINGGTVSISADANLGGVPLVPTAGNVTIAGGILRTTATLSTDANRGITLGTGGGTIDVASGTTTTVGGVIDGANALTKTGLGTLALNGANTYTGATLVQVGTLSVAGGGTLSASSDLTVNGGTFALGGSSTSANNVTLVAGTISGAGGVLTGNSYTVQSGSISAILGGASSSLTKTGTGTVTLTGANTYGGSTNVNAGTLAVGAGGSIPSGSALNVSGGTFDVLTNSTSAGAVTLTSGNINGTSGVLSGASYLVQSGTISGNLGNAAAAMTKTTSGTVTLKGNNTFGGGVTISQGKLVTSSNNALGSGTITLSGGTLQLGDTPTAQGLAGQFYSVTPTNAGGTPTAVNTDYFTLASFNAKYNSLTPTISAPSTTGGVTQLDWPDTAGNPFANQGLTIADNIGARWTGKIRIDNAGLTTFFTRSDDGSMLFIDGQNVVWNNFFQGQTERTGAVDLSAGFHDITLLYYEGGGNSGVTASWIPVGGSKQVIPNSVLSQTPAGTAVTFGSANPVNVTASSTLDIGLTALGSTHNLGALTRSGTNTLSITGNGRTVNFAGTTLSGAPGDNIGFDSYADLNLGQTSDGANTGLTVTKTGPGALILNNGANDLNGTTIDLKAGRLRVLGSGAGVDPLGGAAVILDGGTLSLSNPAGGTTFAPSLTVADNSMIERVGSTNDTLSSSLTIPATKNLNVSVLAGSLAHTSTIGGDGSLTKLGGGTLTLGGSAANTFTGGTTVNTGTLQLNKTAGVDAVRNLTVNYGRVGWSANEQISDSATVNLNGGGTLDLGGNSETIAVLNATGGSISGGTLNVPTINKTFGNTTTISSRLAIAGGNINVTSGTLRLTNTAIGAGANDLSGVNLNISNGGNLRVDRSVGGSNPIGSNAIPLNNGTLTLGGQTSYEQGGLSGQIFRPLPVNIAADNQVSTNTGDANLSLRGLLAYDSLSNLNAAFNTLMAVPGGGGTLTSQINFSGINVMGTIGVGGLGSFMSNSPTPINILNSNITNNVPQSGPYNYGAKWAGKINITNAGLTSFFTASDDGSMLFIDGQQVVYNNFFQGTVERSGSINLTAGLHDIVIAYYQGTGGAEVSASWQPVGGSKQIIPSSVLFAPTITDTAPITTTGSSTINVADAAQAFVGPLSVNGQLNVVGGTVVPSSTTFDGNVTIMTTGGGLITNNVGETNGPVTLNKIGPGSMIMKGASGLSGGINVNGGTLIIDGTSNHSSMNVNSLGTLRLTNQASVGNVDVNINNGGTLDVALVNADLSKVKVGFGGKLSLGAAQNVVNGAAAPASPILGTFEVRGFDIGAFYPLAMPDKSSVNIFTNGGNRIYASELDLNGQVTITTSGNVTTFNGQMGGTGGLTLNSNTEVRLESASTFYTGPTIVETGILKSRESGNLQSTSSVLTIGGEIWADDGGNNFNVDRFNDSGVINMRGGALRHFGKNGSATVSQTSSETFGTVNALGGVTIDSQATAVNTLGIMTINNLLRPVGGRINFPNTNNLGSSTATQTGRIFINNFQNGTGALLPFSSASLNDGIIGGGVTVGNDFATYTDAFGVTAQTTFRTTADAAATPWLATENVKRTITAAEVLAGSKTINSLTIVNAAAQNFDLAANTLTLDTGGFSQSGGNTLTVIQTGGTATTGVITANGGELFALAANTIQFNAPIVNNPATPGTPLALTIGGGGTIRLANNNNSFTGGINISSSTLNTASSGNVGKTIGNNVINFTGNGTLALKDNGSGNGVTLSYGNAVNVYGNATIDVNNSSANNSSNFVLGNLLMDAGRTLNVTGANTYRLTLGATTLNGDAIFNPTTAEVTIGALNDQNAAKTLTKTGFGTMTLSANATSWTGPVIINQGALVVAAPTALGSTAPSVIVNNNGVFGAGVANQDLSNVIFNNGGGLRLSAAMDRSVANTLPTSPLSILEIGIANFPATYNDVPLNPAGAIIRQTATAAVTYASDLTLPGAVQFDIPSQGTTITGQIKGANGSLIKIGGNTLTLSPTAGSNTYNGGTTIMGGTLSANTANSLGTGPVNTIAGTLSYNAPNAAGGQVINANGSSLQLMVGQINIGTLLTGIGNDRFDIGTGNVISGDPAHLALLSRYGNSTMPSNVNLAPGAVVANTGVGSINDLGTTPDLFFGLSSNWLANNITVGANTPWMGVSTDRSSRSFISGDIIVDDGSNGGTQPRTLSAITLQGINNSTLTLGNGTTSPTTGIRKSNAGNSKVDVNLVGRVTLNSTVANFDGVNKFVLNSGSFLSFNQGTAMGSGTGITNIEALSGSVMDIAGGVVANGSINGILTMRAGSVFRVDDANQFTGTGSIIVDPGAIITMRNTGVFGNLPQQIVTGGAVAGSGFPNAKGAIFRLEADNITNLDAVASDQGIFSIAGANRPSTALTINSDPTLGYLNGGVTIYDNNSRTFTPSALNIGAGGMFFSADGSGSGLFTLTVAGSITPNPAAVLTIGSPKIEFQDKNGHVQIDAPFTAPLAGITKITSGDFILNNASSAVAGKLVTGDIIGNGAGGNLKFGNNNTNLSSRLLAGTVANNVLVNDLVKSDINIDGTPFTTTTRGTVLQKFTINGNTNTDGRKLFVSRRAGSVAAGIDLSNIFINAGGVLTVDEDNTDVRVNLTVAGDSTFTQFFTPTGGAVTDQFDLINVGSDVAGTHRTLSQGRVTDISTGISSSTITMMSTIFGNVSGDMTINQVRGRLSFAPGSQILAPTGTQSGAILNSLGVDGNGPAGEGYIEVHAGQDGTGALGSGTVNLGGTTALQMFVDESNGAQIVNNPNLAVNIIPNSSGTIGTNRNLAGTTPGRALLNSVNVGANSTLFMTSANNAQNAIGTVNMAGNGTIVNVASDSAIFVGNVSAGANKVTFDGTRHTQVTGNVTAGQLASNGFVDFNPGAANTSNVTASSVSVRGAITASSGVTDFGTVTITGTPGATVSGLREGVLPGAFNTFDPNPGNFVRPGPMQAKVRVTNTDPGMIQGWSSNTTYAYTGQINIPNSNNDGTGTFAIGECFDDSVQVLIDGNEYLRDGLWNASTSSGPITLTEGWHDVEFRFGQGVGGVSGSAAAGWNSLLAIGLQIGTTGPFDNKTDGVTAANVNGATQSKYTFPIDNGSMNLFRVALPASGDVNVGAGAELRAGGLSGIVNANLNGATGSAATLTLVDTGGPVNSTVSNLAVNGDGAISFGSNSPIAADNLNVAAGATLNLNGGGTLRVSTGHTLGDGSNININAGKLVINSTAGAGAGGVTVNSTGKLGGTGNILGSVTVNSGGHIAPGNSVGTLTLGGLNLTDAANFDIEGSTDGLDKIHIASDGTSDVFTLSGVTNINLFDLGGVAQGDYVIIDYNNANPIADLSNFTITNPNGFSGLAASLINDTANQDIVLHLFGSEQNPIWNVDANGSWGVGANWQSGTTPDSATAIALLLGKITAPRTITLDGNRTLQSLNIDNANKYTIAPGSGGTLTLAGGGGITVEASGSHEISAPVALAGVNTLNIKGGLAMSGGVSIAAGGGTTKTGPGALTISGPQSHGAGASLTVNQGTVNLNSNAGTAGSAAGSNLSLSVVGGSGTAGVTLGANQDLKDLNVQVADPSTQTLDLASPAGAGQFHSVTVYAANLASAKVSLYNALVNANKAGAVDPNDGIIDSGLHAGSKVGLAQSGDHITIRQTKVGDLNLDGNVSISDFLDLASNFGSVGTATWQEGDLNYDRNVSISDFLDLASNFNTSYSGSAGGASAADLQTLASFASSIGVDPSVIGSAVPEPGTLSLLAVGAMGLMSRRRRKA